MFTYAQRGSIKYLEAELLKQYDSIIHAFCSRWGGVSEGQFSNFNFSVSEGDGNEQVLKNWTILSDAFGIPVANFCTVHQVHEDGLLIIDDSTGFSTMQNSDYDAIITNRPGLAVGVKTADCVPIFLFDRVQNAIGVVHAGWSQDGWKDYGNVFNKSGRSYRCRGTLNRPMLLRSGSGCQGCNERRRCYGIHDVESS